MNQLLPDPFGMRWFGIYTFMVLLGTLIGFFFNSIGLFILLFQGIFGVISIGFCERSPKFKRWMLGHWA